MTWQKRHSMRTWLFLLVVTSVLLSICASGGAPAKPLQAQAPIVVAVHLSQMSLSSFAGRAWASSHDASRVRMLAITDCPPVDARTVTVRLQDNAGPAHAWAKLAARVDNAAFVMFVTEDVLLSQDWDSRLESQLAACPASRPLITCSPTERHEVTFPCVHQWTDDGIEQRPRPVADTPVTPVRSLLIDAAFVFGSADLARATATAVSNVACPVTLNTVLGATLHAQGWTPFLPLVCVAQRSHLLLRATPRAPWRTRPNLSEEYMRFVGIDAGQKPSERARLGIVDVQDKEELRTKFGSVDAARKRLSSAHRWPQVRLVAAL